MTVDLCELLLHLYRLAQDVSIEGFQDAALDVLRPVVPFDTSMWGTATTGEQGIDIHTIHLHRTPPEMLADYALVKHMDTAAATVVGQPMVVRGFHANTWPQPREIREFLRRYGHENIFIAADSQPQHQFVHWISLFRADREAHGSAAEVDLLRKLSPHLMQALSMNRVLHLQRASAADRSLSPHGAAMADSKGVLYHHDPLFDALAREEWSGWSGRRLPRQVMDAAQAQTFRHVGRSVVLQGRVEHGGLLFLRARRCCKADRLGAREQLVAQLVVSGHTYKEIAQRLERSPATIRNQIQSIYAKLEVGGIAGLIEALRQADAGLAAARPGA